MEIEKVKEWIKEKHANQIRIQGTPYYFHPLEVVEILKEKGFNEDYQMAGLCHDLIEDTDTTYKEILKNTNKEVAIAVKLVTKELGYNMEEYMMRIQENEMARMVKLADRIHNLRESILAPISFRKRYIEETDKYFLELSKNTLFEKDLKDVIEIVKNSI